jgi:hypothetical protein
LKYISLFSYADSDMKFDRSYYTSGSLHVNCEKDVIRWCSLPNQPLNPYDSANWYPGQPDKSGWCYALWLKTGTSTGFDDLDCNGRAMVACQVYNIIEAYYVIIS